MCVSACCVCEDGGRNGSGGGAVSAPGQDPGNEARLEGDHVPGVNTHTHTHTHTHTASYVRIYAYVRMYVRMYVHDGGRPLSTSIGYSTYITTATAIE